VADFDIRTDRWEIAAETMDSITRGRRAKRDDKPKSIGEEAKKGMEAEKGSEKPKDTGGESTQAT